jgi:polysaccharide export outer membrane protein
MRPTILFLFFTVSALQVWGQVGSEPATQALTKPGVSTLQSTGTNLPALQERNPPYRFRVNDSFDLEFPFSPEFSQAGVRVGPDGYIPLHGAQPVHVAGLTVSEASEAIRNAYSGILHAPEVTIVLKEFEKPYFVASGQVEKPGKYDLLGETTVTQALAVAGGLTESAKHSQVLLFRRVSADWVKVTKLNVKQMLKSENLQEDVFLKPGDMLYVPKNAISKIRPFIPYTNTGMVYTLTH